MRADWRAHEWRGRRGLRRSRVHCAPTLVRGCNRPWRRTGGTHGVTFAEVRRGNDGRWDDLRESALNRRITGETSSEVRGGAAGHRLMPTDRRSRRKNGAREAEKLSRRHAPTQRHCDPKKQRKWSDRELTKPAQTRGPTVPHRDGAFRQKGAAEAIARMME
ncbi:MAG: alkaline phosphatase PhoX [Verrucomicrobiota bacterium]